MLYVIQKGFNGVPITPAQDIVYCVSSVAEVLAAGLDFVFTDRHAVNSLSSQYSKDDIARIDELLDTNAIKAKYWTDENDLDLKSRKEAEFLILGDLPFEAVRGFVVYNEAAKNRLLDFGIFENQIHIKANAYF